MVSQRSLYDGISLGGVAGRIVAWSDCVLSAEAKKAGRASEATRLTPRLASVIVGEA